MKKIKYIFTFLIILLATSFVSAQVDPPANDFVEKDNPQNRDERIAEALGLSQEQIQQIRQINQQGRFQMREAQQRFRQVRAELDEYIYTDTINETTLQTKLRAVVEAQAEVIKVRAMTELAVRNVLTPEQLVKFRNLRNRIRQQRRNNMQQRQQQLQNRRMINPNQRDRIPQDRPQPPRNRP